MTTKTDEHGPNVPYQAITMLKGVKQYGDELAESVRHIKQYSRKDLEAKGITKNGKVQGEGLWAYVNHLAESLIEKQNFDKNDPRWKATYQAVSNVVKQFGAKGITTDLLEAVIGTYLNTATQYVAERDQQTVASLPTEEGRAATRAIAQLTGNNVIYGPWIKQAIDPTEVAGIKGQLESELRTKVNTAIATGTIDDLVAQTQHGTRHDRAA